MNRLELPIMMFTQGHMTPKITTVTALSMKITLMVRMMIMTVEPMKIGLEETQNLKQDLSKT